MPDDTKGEAAPANTPDPAANPPATPPAAPEPPKAKTSPPDTGGNENPAWLGQRLEAERKKMLKELGVDSEGDAREIVKLAREKLEAEKSEIQKLTEKIAAAETKAERAERLELAVAAIAGQQMAELTEAQQAAVKAVAGEDPARQVSMIEAFRATWKTDAAPSAGATAQPPATDGNNQSTNTAPPRGAPNDSGGDSQPDYKAQHATLKGQNPFLAAGFLNANSSRIYPSGQ